MRRASGALLCASSLAGTTVTAQPARSQAASPASRPSADSARLAADLFFRAVADEQWERAAGMLDSAWMQRLVAEQVRQPPQRAERMMTIDDCMRDDPNKPRAVAEYQLGRHQEQVAKFDAGSLLSSRFFGVRTVEDLRLLSPLQAGVRYLKAQDLAFHRIIATALASDTVAYVLHDDGMFASRWDAAAPLEPMVMQLRRRSGRWRIIPTHGLIGRGGMGFIAHTECDSTRTERRRR